MMALTASPCGKSRRRKSALLLICTVTAVALLGGCSGYQLRGTVIEGDKPAVLVVNKNDPRLDRPGVPGAVLDFVIDPSRLSPKAIGMLETDESGRFSTDVDVTGAGFLEYDLGVSARAVGYRDLWEQLPMPGGNKRLLIILAEGSSGPPRTPDVLEEALQWQERYMNQ